MPLIDPTLELFTIFSEEDSAFYNSVYFGASFSIGHTYNHQYYVVTPQNATPAEVAAIRSLRAQAGISSDDGFRNQSPPVAGGRLPRLRLPREPVEALPLPG